MNYIRTGILMAGLTALFGAVGYLLGGPAGMLIALAIAAATNLFSYWSSDRLALAAHNAQEVDEHSAPELYGMVRDLAARANLPMPRVYLIDEEQPNAFATGRNPQNAAVAATAGIMRTLTYEELAGVMAHELAHIKNHDTLTMTITATMAGAISSLTTFGMMFGSRENRPGLLMQILISVLAPLAAMVIQMAISRSREYEADRLGGEIVGNPAWLADALAKIAGAVPHIPNETVEMKPATAHMFIINPLTGQGMDSLFSTHPDTGNRIAALMEQARAMGVGQTPAPGGFTGQGAKALGPAAAANPGPGAEMAVNPIPQRRDDDAPGLPARRLAATVIDEVLRAGVALDETFDRLAQAFRLDGPDLALARAIAITGFRRLGTIQHVINARLERGSPRNSGPFEPIVVAAAAQILFLGVPDHAAVDLAIRLLHEDARSARYVSLGNALLRRLAREREAILQEARDPFIDTPPWLAESWCASYGTDIAAAIARSHRDEGYSDWGVG